MSNQIFVPATSKSIALAENALVRARIAKAVLSAVMEEYVDSPQDVACTVFQASREALGEALNFLYAQADNAEEEICALVNESKPGAVVENDTEDFPDTPDLPTLDDEGERTE